MLATSIWYMLRDRKQGSKLNIQWPRRQNSSFCLLTTHANTLLNYVHLIIFRVIFLCMHVNEVFTTTSSAEVFKRKALPPDSRGLLPPAIYHV